MLWGASGGMCCVCVCVLDGRVLWFAPEGSVNPAIIWFVIRASAPVSDKVLRLLRAVAACVWPVL